MTIEEKQQIIEDVITKLEDLEKRWHCPVEEIPKDFNPWFKALAEERLEIRQPLHRLIFDATYSDGKTSVFNNSLDKYNLLGEADLVNYLKLMGLLTPEIASRMNKIHKQIWSLRA